MSVKLASRWWSVVSRPPLAGGQACRDFYYSNAPSSSFMIPFSFITTGWLARAAHTNQWRHNSVLNSCRQALVNGMLYRDGILQGLLQHQWLPSIQFRWSRHQRQRPRDQVNVVTTPRCAQHGKSSKQPYQHSTKSSRASRHQNYRRVALYPRKWMCPRPNHSVRSFRRRCRRILVGMRAPSQAPATHGCPMAFIDVSSVAHAAATDRSACQIQYQLSLSNHPQTSSSATKRVTKGTLESQATNIHRLSSSNCDPLLFRSFVICLVCPTLKRRRFSSAVHNNTITHTTKCEGQKCMRVRK